MKDVVICISTVNGTGSLSANQLLSKILFRHGFNVGSYNFFPSNIAGLPCMYSLRVNTQGHATWQEKADLLVSLNPKTLSKDLKYLKSSGCLLTDKKFPPPDSFNGNYKALAFSQSLIKVKDCPLKAKKALKNIIYVGFISRSLGLDPDLCRKTISGFFTGKSKTLVECNLTVFQAGWEMADIDPLDLKLDRSALSQKDSILIDGNSASALGALTAGCQFVSWYPITPATSLAETFKKIRKSQ